MQLPEDRLANLLGPWTSGTGPRSRRLGERLATLVEQGVLAEGTRLPTERALAAHLGVSRTTVAAAYDLLHDRGLAESRQGSGTEVRRPAGASRGPRGTSTMFASLGGAAPGVIDLSLAEPPSAEPTRRLLCGVDPVAVATACGDTGYQPYGWGPLRADLADLLGSDGLPTSVDGLVVTTGAQQAISLATQVLTRPGDLVLVEEATYPGALEVFRTRGPPHGLRAHRRLGPPARRARPRHRAPAALARLLHPGGQQPHRRHLVGCPLRGGVRPARGERRERHRRPRARAARRPRAPGAPPRHPPRPGPGGDGRVAEQDRMGRAAHGLAGHLAPRGHRRGGGPHRLRAVAAGAQPGARPPPPPPPGRLLASEGCGCFTSRSPSRRPGA